MKSSLTYRRKNSGAETSSKEPKINQLLINQKKFNDIVMQKVEVNSNLLIEILKKFNPKSMMNSFNSFPKRSFKRLLNSFEEIKRMIETFNQKVISATYRTSSLTRSSKLSEMFKMTSTKSTLTREDIAPILIQDSQQQTERVDLDVKVTEISPALEFDSYYYTAVTCSDAQPPQELTVKTYFGYHMDDPEHVRHTQKSK